MGKNRKGFVRRKIPAYRERGANIMKGRGWDKMVFGLIQYYVDRIILDNLILNLFLTL